MDLQGRSIVAGEVASSESNDRFFAVDAATSERLEPAYVSASHQDVDRAVTLASEATVAFRDAAREAKVDLLSGIADGIEAEVPSLVERATKETGLPEARIRGESGRTCNQLRLFAGLVRDGGWVDARIDRADAKRQPVPKPDVRSMLRGRGPVAVFGASNFPLAFSVAGGDTASALAGGNPVIVKAHPAHPGTSEIVGRVIQRAVRSAGLPSGVFSLLFDEGHGVGQALVTHPGVAAVAFTGSRRGGRALMDLAAGRPEPIPVFAEMGSVNPVFLLAGALERRGEEIARGLAGSVQLGAGQFCTNPGLVFVDAAQADSFVTALKSALADAASSTMLTAAIAKSYHSGVARLDATEGVRRLAGAAMPPVPLATAAVFETEFDRFMSTPHLKEEVFGPSSIVVRCSSIDEMLAAARSLEGQLTASVHADQADHSTLSDLARVLEGKVGRLNMNGFPTGVEVCPSMVHGGPYPATADGSTSVGTRAIVRFCRAVAYQDWPEDLLPPELKDANPLSIRRMVDGVVG